jgi:hypothetical protein
MAWDTPKNPNDIISSSDYNASVSDQKSRGIPSQEAKNGSDCTGSDGDTGRALTLANASAIKAAGRMIFRNGAFLDPNDYSITGSPPNDVVTFSGVNIFNTDRIIVVYFL